MKNGVSTVTLDQLIEAALKGQNTRNHERLGKEAKRYALAIARAKAPDLPPDLLEDIFQQAFVELFQFGPKALIGTTGKALFRKAVLNAVRVVRASYAPPGARTRRRKDQEAVQTAAGAIDHKMDHRRVRRAGHTGLGEPPTDVERLPDPRQQVEFSHINNVIYVERLLDEASPPTVHILRRIHFEDAGVGVTAAEAKISRFALNRRLQAFYDAVRAAA